MAKNDEVEHEPLTEEQRITALEERVGTNKIVLLVLALLLIVIISVSITIITMSAFEEEVDIVEVQTVTDLQLQVSQLSAENTTLKKEINNQKKILLVIQEQQSNTSNSKLLGLAIKQEQSHQEFLDALRAGMYDLAHMLPGSRTWLAVYGEKVDNAVTHSKAREQELKAMSSGNEDDW